MKPRGAVKVGIIGLGRLGSALARGLDQAAGIEEVLGYGRNRAKAEAAAARAHKLRLCASAEEVISGADLVFLWTKPEDARAVMQDSSELIRRRNSLLVSSTPGVPLAAFTDRWAETLPNVNMAVRQGVTPVHYAPGLSAADRARVRDTLALVGGVYELPVEEIPFYSALCSCGPALYATAMEIMADVLSRRRGYDRELCRRMVRETVSGTIALQERDSADAAAVVEQVAHPGGPSEAGVRELRAHLPSLVETMLRGMGKWSPKAGKAATPVERDVRLRPAGHADVERLMAMVKALYAEDCGIHYDPARLRPALDDLIDNGSYGRAWLIDADRPEVGYMVVVFGYSLEWHGRDAFVDELYVEPSSRGKGVGSRALALAEESCRAVGIRALHLEVERMNSRAQELYRRLGYRDHERYLMTKTLAG